MHNSNPPQSDIFKLAKICSLMIIPGPKNPKRLVSFLEPFFDELDELREGVQFTFWDGEVRTVRVHLLFIGADIMARTKLTLTKGPNGYCACIFCTMRGIRIPERRHVYFPDVLQSNSKYSNSTGQHIIWEYNKL